MGSIYYLVNHDRREHRMSDHEMLNQAGPDQNWSQQKLRFNFTLEIFTPDTQTTLSSNIWTRHSGLNAAHQQKCPKDDSNLAPDNRPIVLFCLFSAYFESKTNSAKWQRDTETSRDDKEEGTQMERDTESKQSHRQTQRDQEDFCDAEQ